MTQTSACNVIHGPGFSYVDIQHINKGAYGDIMMGKQTPSNRKVVLKKISKQIDHSRIAGEVLAGHVLNGIKGIPHFHHHFETSSSYWLVSDYVEGTDLFHRLSANSFKGLPERTVKTIMQQLVRILVDAHARGVAHKGSFLPL
jgi:serine/threonine protein kinase